MSLIQTALFTVLFFMASDALLQAQWLTFKTPGIPRTADGKPDLTAPSPKTPDGKPDLSGLWRVMGGGYGGDITSDLKPADIQPWAQSLYKQRMENLGNDDQGIQCLPFGPRYVFDGGMVRILQTPSVIAFLYEDLVHRQIFMDGRTLPQDPNPDWMGYSVGHWEGDTLVVESAGFNDRTWLDGGGHPHTEALHLTERYQRRDFGHMALKVTIEDPKAYNKPWTIEVKVELAPDTEMIEYVCAENEKDLTHLVGKASDQKKNEIELDPAILAKYMGSYLFHSPFDEAVTFTLNVTLDGKTLFLDEEGKGKLPLSPISETTFLFAGERTYFEKDDKGATQLVVDAVEGKMIGVRKPPK
jgi:hypothetical protein